MFDLFGREARRTMQERVAGIERMAAEAFSAVPDHLRKKMSSPWPLRSIVEILADEAHDARAALAQAREDLKAANARAHSTGVAMATQSALDRAAVDIAIDRAEAAEKELADARHVIDQCEADRQALARERDAAAMEAQAFFDLAVEIERQDRELLRLIGNAANQLEMAQGTTTRR